MIRRAQSGDRGAFGELFQAYQVKAFRTAYLITRDRHLAEDMTQEAFVRAYLAIKRCDPDRPFAPWFFRILINICRTTVERRGRQVSVAQVPEEPTVDDGLGPIDARAVVWRALQRLEPVHRDPLMLRYYHQFTDPEIAEALDLPLGTVKSRLHKARKLLEEQLGPAAERDLAEKEALS